MGMNLTPKILYASELTDHLLRIMLLGLERQFEANGDTKPLKPVRDLLMDGPLAKGLPACLVSFIASNLNGPSATDASGEVAPSSSLGLRNELSPSNHWLWAAGQFMEEVK